MLHILWKAAHHIFSYNQQSVSGFAYFMKSSFITSFLNRLWVTLWMAMLSLITSFSMTNSLWVALLVKGCLITHFFYDKQRVSGIDILWKAILSLLFLWLAESEWDCTFCERQLHDFFFYDWQKVSEIAHFVKDNLITSFPMTNSKWVTLHIL